MSSDTDANKWSKRLALATTIYGIANKAGAAYKKHRVSKMHTLKVSDSAEGYLEIMELLLENSSGPMEYSISNSYSKTRLYESSNPKKISILGHTYLVLTETVDAAKVRDIDGGVVSPLLVFKSHSEMAMRALEDFIYDIAEERMAKSKSSCIPLVTANHAGAPLFSQADRRDMDSVVLHAGEKEALVKDIEDFIKFKSRYLLAGIPWHRGYLLYGEPGNGKSSIAKAIATKFNRSIWRLSLGSIKDDSALEAFISRVDTDAVLLIEDIDIFVKEISRDGNQNGPTLAGLLNCLDGVNTPSGLITFITTNNKHILDDALIRPGRIDFTMELKAPGPREVLEMFKVVYEEEVGFEPQVEFKSMAELSNLFKTNIDNPDVVREALRG